MRHAKKSIVCAGLAASLSWCEIAHATEEWNAVHDDMLSEMRGGFDAGAGLRISFGIEREGYINGKLVATTSFNIPNVARIDTAQANAIAQTVIRNGTANTPDAAKGTQASAALVIQNTLNLQNIRSLTVINATSNSLDLIKALNLQSTLADALAQSLGRR
ncbi:MAG: hypothetical protein V7642_4433 [Burkholderiales bacterium]|jgi:hypothetical protein